MFSAEAHISGTIRKVGELSHYQGSPCITVSIPDNRKDQPTTWYELTFWDAHATIAEANFRNGTILTARCSMKVKNDRLRLNVNHFTVLSWGPDKQEPA
jgi:hypothetical protein